jgi:hypothetical protein
LFSPQQSLPYLIADAASFEQGVQRLFPRPDVDDSVDVLSAAGEKSSAENTVWHFGGGWVVVLQVEER